MNKLNCVHLRLFFAAIVTSLLLCGSARAQKSRVVSVNLSAATGAAPYPCPATINFTGTIAATGPGTVRYIFIRSDGSMSAEQSIEFKEAGEQSVNTNWMIGTQGLSDGEGWIVLRAVSPNLLETNKAVFKLNCHGAAPLPQVNQRRPIQTIAKEGQASISSRAEISTLGNQRTKDYGPPRKVITVSVGERPPVPREPARIDPGRVRELSDPDVDSNNVQIASAGNNVYVVWSSKLGENSDVFIATSQDGGATFGAPLNLSHNSGQSLNPHVAASGEQACVVWQDNTPGHFNIFWSFSRDGGRRFNEAANLSGNRGDAQDPQVILSGSSPYFVWADNSSGNNEVYFRDLRYAAAVNVSQTPSNSRAPHIAISGTNIYVIWQDNPLGDDDVNFAQSTNSGQSFARAGEANNHGLWLSPWTNYGDQFNAQLTASGDYVYLIYEGNRPGSRTINLVTSSRGGNLFMNDYQREHLDDYLRYYHDDLLNNDRYIVGYNAPPEKVEGYNVPFNGQVAAAGGKSYSVWSEYYYSQSPQNRRRILYYLPLGDGESGIENELPTAAADVRSPQIALSGEDRFIVYQGRPAGPSSNRDVFMQSLNAEGLNPETNLSNNRGESTSPKVAVAGRTPIIVWEDNTGGHWEILCKVPQPAR